MFEKLSDGLRGSLKKIRDAVFVDDTLINEITRDIQRSLLSADVNVKLVMQLTGKIKERIKGDSPKGLTKKDYLVTILYEELTAFLGGEGAKIQLTKKPFTIMLVGLFGNGKCLDKDSQVLLSTGESLRIEDLYKRHRNDGEEQLEDGFIIELKEPIQVPSFNPNTLKIEHKSATHLWKLGGKDLVEVTLHNGNDQSVKTTPEHPFFVLENGTVKQRRSADLQEGDYVAIPRQVPSSIGEVMDQDLAALLGYILGDGYLCNKSVHISTADEEVIARIQKISLSKFNRKATVTADKRSRAKHIRINSVELVKHLALTYNLPLGPKGRNLSIPSSIQKAPHHAQKAFIQAYFDCDSHMMPKQRQVELVSESELLIKQMQHLLLQHGIVSKRSVKKLKNQTYGRLFIEARYAELYAEKIGSSLTRKQNVLNTYKQIGKGQGDGSQDMFPTGNLLREARENHGCTVGQVQEKVSSYGLYEAAKRISRSQLQRLLAVYNTEHGRYKDLLFNDNFRQGTNKKTVAIRNTLLARAKKEGLVQDIVNDYEIPLTTQGFLYVQQLEEQLATQQLALLANADVSWAQVESVKPIENTNGYVYDLTVEDNHSFIAEGVIVHNTTTAAKLAKYYQKRGVKVALLSTDTWRPAAAEQLLQLGKQIGVPTYGNPKEKDPVKIYKSFEGELKKADLIIVDTAGRDALNDELIEELSKISKIVAADEVLLVMAADVGQSAESQAKTFHDTCNVTGVVITKLDGTAKGGGALSACAITQAPVKFIGVGEKVDALEEFKPKNFVGRLLGMGDLETLLEKAKEAMSEDDAKDLQKKLLKGDFTLIDLYDQMEAMKKMGPLQKVMEMIPGMGNLQIPKEAMQVQEGKLEVWKHVMNSMTREELEDPEIMNPGRVTRVAKGSGLSEGDVKDLVKQHKQSKKLFKMLKGRGSEKDMQKMMKKMQGMVRR